MPSPLPTFDTMDCPRGLSLTPACDRLPNFGISQTAERLVYRVSQPFFISSTVHKLMRFYRSAIQTSICQLSSKNPNLWSPLHLSICSSVCLQFQKMQSPTVILPRVAFRQITILSECHFQTLPIEQSLSSLTPNFNPSLKRTTTTSNTLHPSLIHLMNLVLQLLHPPLLLLHPSHHCRAKTQHSDLKRSENTSCTTTILAICLVNNQTALARLSSRLA